jgi:hypothetical protein
LNKLDEGLSSFLGYDKTIHPLAKVLSSARKAGRISYSGIEKIKERRTCWRKWQL